ncbi:hypothetical protein TcWFU_006816 [Taenia crassiceps]|uniref:Uncharacterized protein n=1 Tax=Taenia crassiceps TaxID=6207 RepID=A0ABR4QRW4_9CEST
MLLTTIHTIFRHKKTRDPPELSRWIIDVTVQFLPPTRTFDNRRDWFAGAFLTSPITLWLSGANVEPREVLMATSKSVYSAHSQERRMCRLDVRPLNLSYTRHADGLNH